MNYPYLWGIILAGHSANLNKQPEKSMNCHQCGGIITASDRFCEECGVSLVENLQSPIIDLTTSPTSTHGCQKCGAPPDQIDSDRYCVECGFRQVQTANDAIEIQLAPNLAGASDRGRRHHQNEDAIVLKIIDPDTHLLVVCDGVSSSQNPELASQLAATACIHAIKLALSQDPKSPTIALEQGVAAALKAVSSIPVDPTDPTDPASTTIVTAIVQGHTATIAWLGDSRAYWISPEKSIQLTQDDSWMREAIESGQYTIAQAEASPHAHAIVRWLGADVIDDSQPNLITFTLPSAGYLLLCTDGLWNYAPDPAYLHHLILQAPNLDSLEICRHLISYANQQGGQDNITVGIFMASGQ
jgi:PPM family protein phosphatase